MVLGVYQSNNPWYYPTMIAKTTLDQAGRVVIPKPLRKELRLEPGDTLQMESHDDQITLRPVRAVLPLQKERGVWVFRTGRPLPASVTDETLRRLREERDLQNLGKAR